MTEEPLTDSASDALVREMVMEDPLVWWEGFTRIEDKQTKLIKPVANRLQQDIAEYVVYCRKHELPIRAVIPKPRQKGISTITVAILAWFLKIMVRHGLIVAGKEWQNKSLWSIYSRYAQTDEFGWGFDGYVQAESAELGNGSTLKQQTAGGKDPGRSATIQFLLGTEVAYWGHDDSVKNAAAVLTGLMASLADGPNTVAFLESTSSGGSGLFYRRAMDAVPLRDFLNGARHPSGWVMIFRGWHEFPDSVLPVTSAKEEQDILSGIGARNEFERVRERQLRMEHRLTAGQIKYWRKLLSDCDNDPDKRDREYPTTVEDAFRAAQPCRFNLHHLRIMKQEAQHESGNVRPGMLDQPVEDVPHYVWRDCGLNPEDANFFLWEPPTIGFRYNISVDNAGGLATGDDPKDTDCHAVTVIREGYVHPEKGWIRPAIVATIKPQQRVDIDILEEWVWRLHVFYGRCLIVPEANNDRGLIRGLRKRGALIYQQERPATQVHSHKPSGKYGVWTRGGENEGTRNWMVENLARAVRELTTLGEGIFCPFPWIIDEMMHFATDPDTGKAEAMDGWHDDWVLALMIGWATKSGATVYMPQSNSAPLPRDLRLDSTEDSSPGADRI